MTIEFLGPDPAEDKELKVFRVKAQTDVAIIQALDFGVTFEKAKEDAQFLTNYPTLPYVIEEICTKEEWNLGTINFCPRCGHKLDVPEAGLPNTSVTIDCDDCQATCDVFLTRHSILNDEKEGSSN